MILRPLSRLALAMAILSTGAAVAAPVPDPGKKACIADARRLCPAAMNTMSRKKVEACMIARIDDTSPACHDTMLKMKAEREGAAPR